MARDVMLAALQEALADIPEAEPKLKLLAQHWDLINRWQKRLNLTAIREPTDAAWLHYRDSLEALAVLTDGDVVDIGSGGGFPGLPIAIVRRHTAVTLLEGRRRKASFLEVAAAELNLQNVTVIHGRMEQLPSAHFDNAITRATFSSTAELLHCLEWVRPGGQLIAMRTKKGGPSASEVHAYNIRGVPRVLEIFRA